MPRRLVVFMALAVALAAAFVRLGFWQLSRLAERRASNADIERRLGRLEVPITELAGDDSARLRRAVVRGTPDASGEFVVTGRSRNGSPGVWIITPVRPPASGAAVLVNRGWVYAPDAATADLPRWREPRTEFHGYTQRLGTLGSSAPRGRAVRALDSAAVDSLLPYPAAPLYLVVQDSATSSSPARLPMPALDDGPHLSYAIQWFCFAAIAVGGAIVVFVTRDSSHG